MKELRRATGPVLVCVVLSGLTVYLFGSSSPLAGYLSLDLTFLIWPIIVFLILRLGRKLILIVMPKLGGRLLAHVLGGTALAAAGYLLVQGVASDYAVMDSIWTPIGLAGGYFVLFVAGFTSHGLAELLGKEPEFHWTRPATGFLGHLLMGVAVYWTLLLFRAYWAGADLAGAIILAGFATSALSMLAHYGETSSNRFVADLCRWLAASGGRMFFLGAFLLAYVALLRPWIVDNFAYAPLLEWGIVCFVAWRVYRGVRFLLKNRYSAPLKESKWERHAQESAEQADERLVFLSRIQKEFVEMGLRPRLLVNLIVTLNANRWEPDEMCAALIPLINFQGERVPWYAFIWDQNRIQTRNQARRRDILERVMANVTQHPKAISPSTLTEATA